ncbi:YoaK family protein [Povalibacter sp.]|uniref:YoaK family protein n=1 Tax=Povalibacter sp. TaxID=1962978 RepID=UPI002F3E3084
MAGNAISRRCGVADAVNGFVIGNESLNPGHRYGAALLDRGSSLGHYLASGACGLQNAMTSTYSGAVVRTTHVTGLFTDIGITVGLWLRGQAADRRRVILYVTLICGFILGGTVGAAGFNVLRFQSMLIPASVATAMAVAYLAYWHRQRQLAQPR